MARAAPIILCTTPAALQRATIVAAITSGGRGIDVHDRVVTLSGCNKAGPAGRLSALRRRQRQAPVGVELPPNSLRVPTAGLSVAPSERDVQLTGGLSRGSWQESEQPRPTSGCHRRDTARCRRRSTSRNRGTGPPDPMAGGTCSPWPGRSCHSCRWDVPGGPLVTLRILVRRLKRRAVNDQRFPSRSSEYTECNNPCDQRGSAPKKRPPC